jgi:crotonobetainyl-CoA:carnitine CoA-transferase CaiB-like acyl-CoA transferase
LTPPPGADSICGSVADSALSDLKVLDLGTDVAAPYAARMLADLGADVIKVEPLAGDPSRRRGPFPDDLPDAEKSGLFLHLNANKRGVSLDYATATGRRLLYDLVRWADVVIESEAPSRAEALGLSWTALEAVKPGLVLVSVTPFGQTGPYRDWAAEEITVFALSSRMWMHGLDGMEPLRYGPDVAWFQVGSTAAVAALAAVFASQRFGIGQQVDVSALEALTGNVDARPLFAAMTGQPQPRPARALSTIAGVAPCKDGYMLLIAGSERFFRRLLRAIGAAELIGDPRFVGQAARAANAGELDAIVLPWLADRTRREAFDQLQAYSVMCAPVQTIDEALDDPQLVARDFFVPLDHPVAGRWTYPGAPFLMSETPWTLRRPAPLLGEHNREVYGGLLGLGDDDLALLAASGVI